MLDHPFFWGTVGGIGGELLKWYSMREQLHAKKPDYATSWSYWIITILMILAGGGIAFIHGIYGTVIHPFLGMNIGASAPLILKEIVHNSPEIKPTQNKK